MHLDDTDVYVPGKGNVYGSGVLLDIFRRDWQFWIWALQRHWIWLATVPVVFAFLFFMIRTWTAPKLYESKVALVRQEIKYTGGESGVPTGFVQPQLNVLTSMITGNKCMIAASDRLKSKWSPEALQRMVRIEQEQKNSNYILLAVITDNAEDSAIVANTVADVFIDVYRDFLSSHVDELYNNSEKSCIQLRAEISTLHNNELSICKINDISGNLKQEITLVTQRIADTETMLQHESGTLDGAKLKVSDLEKVIASTPEEVEVYREESMAADISLATARQDLIRLKQIYTDENPKVKIQIAKIAEMEKNLAAQDSNDGRSKVVIGKNPAYINALNDLSRARLDMVASEAHIKQYHEDLTKLRARQQVLNDLAPEFSVIDLSIDQKKDTLATQEAITKNLEFFRERSFTDTNIYERAVPNPEPVSRKRSLYAAIGFLLGLMFTGGTLLSMEALNLSVRSKVDMEKGLTLPVLGVAPVLAPEHRADFYSALQGMVGNLEGLMKDIPRPAMVAVAPVEFTDPEGRVTEELLNILAVRGISCLRIRIMEELPSEALPHLLNDFLYKFSDALPEPSVDGIYYFKLDDMAFMASPSRDVLKTLRDRLTDWDLVVWELFEYNLHPQLFMEICNSSDLTVFMMEFSKTSKLEVYNILRQIRIAGVRNIVGGLFNVENKFYRKVN
ncbi:MAG: hypothetical protein AB7F40_11735 [Victivallaceae bacterium]|nr:hypothetical protein [Victivallaceae bacterium]